MHLTCVICSDLFTPSSDIYSTQCGHIFHFTCLLHWLENSKTCPQCRQKTSQKSLVRLFVNIATTPGLEADVTVLQHKMDSMEFSMKLKDKEMQNIAMKNQETQAQNKALRGKIKELEMTEMRHDSAVAALKEQIKYFKSQTQSCGKLQEEITRLRHEMRDMEHVQIAISGSRQQVNDIIRNEKDVDSLALLAATLKKSLVDTDRRKKELMFELKKTQNELSQTKRKMTELECEYKDTKRQLDSLKQNYDKEVHFMKEKFSQLRSKACKGTNESLDKSIARITAESPVNFNRGQVVVDLTQSSGGGTPEPSKRIDDDDTIDSPITASSMGMFGLQMRQKSSVSSNKFSIFKHNPPVLEPVVFRPKIKRADVNYDGLGGCSKEDIYPSGNLQRPVKKMKTGTSSKFKKLSADAGKNRKMSDYFNPGD